MPIEISVNMYSGRRDPTMDLAADEIEELRRRLEMSRQHPLKEHHEPPQFGYRGFVIFDEAREAGLPYRTDIFGGFVVITEERPEPPPRSRPQPLFYRDAGQVEDWLLERAAEHGLSEDITAMGGPYRKAP